MKLFRHLFLFFLLTACSLPQKALLPTEPPITTTPSVTPSQTLTLLTPSETPTFTPVPSLTPTPEPILYSVPILSQDGLTLNGAPTGVGCVPVCIEMITSYWNTTSDLPILPAQEIIDIKGAEGSYIPGKGMSSASAADLLAEKGYHHEMRMNSSKDELLLSFEEIGPLGLLVKTNWVPGTMNHSVVMTGYDPSTDTITINDPFYGSSVRWSWEAFDGIWGLNYAGDSDYPGADVRRIFFLISPYPIPPYSSKNSE